MVKQLQNKMFHFLRQRISTQSKLGWGEETGGQGSEWSGAIPGEGKGDTHLRRHSFKLFLIYKKKKSYQFNHQTVVAVINVVDVINT